MRHSHIQILCAVSITIWAAILICFILGTPGHWWFEDDPAIYRFASVVTNPLHLFLDKSHFAPAASNEVIPLLTLSFWFDNKIAPRSVAFCYLHSAFAFWLAMLLLFFLLERVFKNNLHAVLITIGWSILPSTVATHEFLSTRCYMEGFILACGALYLVLRIAEGSLRQSFANMTLMIVFLLGAVLAKEFYPATLLPMALGICLWGRKFLAASLVAGVAVFYAVYRMRMVGLSLDYGIPHLALSEYLLFLSRLPHYLAGTSGGYLLLAIAALALVLSKGRASKSRGLYYVIGVGIVTSIIVLYPVSSALAQAWKEHGTWVRSGFVLNSILVVLFAKLIVDMKRQRLALAFVLAAVVVVSKGSAVTIKTWTTMKRNYELEGRFVVNGPRGVLYSSLPATWFLPGLIALYPESRNRDYIQKGQPVSDTSLVLIKKLGSVWRAVDDKIQEDAILWGQILANARWAQSEARW